MNLQMIERYGDIALLNVFCDEEVEIDRQGVSYVRVQTPATEAMQRCYTKQGLFHADRMLKASINLMASNISYEKMVRLEIRKTRECREQILKIALKSFPVDRRFHVAPHYDNKIAGRIISSWVNESEEFYVCVYCDKVIGFAALERGENAFYEIKLAAVDADYRASGAALSLYAYLAQICSEKFGGGLSVWLDFYRKYGGYESVCEIRRILFCTVGYIFGMWGKRGILSSGIGRN